MRVFITGAAGGLGRTFAVECAERGYDLFLTDISADKLEILKGGLMRSYNISVETAACDLTDGVETGSLLQRLRNEGYTFDMLFNVAGLDFEGGFMQCETENILKIVQLNIEATLRVTHGLLQQRGNKQNPFYIVFVSSLASMYPMPLKATYAASKRFLLDFSCALGQELKSDNIKVLTLCPGGLATRPDTIEAINAQGFFGNLTTNKLESVAGRTVTLALKGRRRYLPGFINGLFSFFGNLIPRYIVVKLLYSRWKKAQQKWLYKSAV